jgi:hypothetical protein
MIPIKIFLLLFFINSFCNAQTKSDIIEIDSLMIYHMPLNSRGSFSLDETEFRNFESRLKRKVILKEKDLINDIYYNILKQEKIINKKSLSVFVIFDFYNSGKIVNTVLMDCNGLISIQSIEKKIFFDFNLNNFFKKLTKQENVICGY